MLEKITSKIDEELEKVLKEENLSLEDIKYLMEIKHSMEFHKKINEVDLSNGGFFPVNNE